jgi:hypothetical protein
MTEITFKDFQKLMLRRKRSIVKLLSKTQQLEIRKQEAGPA